MLGAVRCVCACNRVFGVDVVFGVTSKSSSKEKETSLQLQQPLQLHAHQTRTFGPDRGRQARAAPASTFYPARDRASHTTPTASIRSTSSSLIALALPYLRLRSASLSPRAL